MGSRIDAGTVVWITGLPSSGKSTLAASIHDRLVASATPACILDGDAVRGALVPALGYSASDRDAFYETLARLAALLAAQGLVVLVPATASRAAFRERARALSGHFLEVFVDVDPRECARRDAKGLYAAAEGGLPDVPGRDEPFEPPSRPDVVARGGRDADAIQKTMELLEPEP